MVHYHIITPDILNKLDLRFENSRLDVGGTERKDWSEIRDWNLELGPRYGFAYRRAAKNNFKFSNGVSVTLIAYFGLSLVCTGEQILKEVIQEQYRWFSHYIRLDATTLIQNHNTSLIYVNLLPPNHMIQELEEIVDGIFPEQGLQSALLF